MAKKKTEEKVPSEPGSKRRTKFDFEPYDEIVEPREGSKRAAVARLLRRKNGATVQEIMDEIGWTYATTYECLKLLHTTNGFGMSEDEKGRIRLVEPAVA